MKNPRLLTGAEKLYEVQDKGEQNEDQCKPLGSLGQLGIEGLAFALAEESVSTAGDSTGETGTLAALHEDDDHNGQTGDNLKNSKDNGESRHVFQSFRFYTNSQLVEYNTRNTTIQVFS